ASASVLTTFYLACLCRLYMPFLPFFFYCSGDHPRLHSFPTRRSSDLANGLGIRRARVEGQFWEGQVSLFSAQEAPAEVLGMPYVVFPGNVGGEQALADVVDTLTAAVAAR